MGHFATSHLQLECMNEKSMKDLSENYKRTQLNHYKQETVHILD